MPWLERLGEPLAPTREEAARLIQAELEAAVPKGWVLRDIEGDALAWSIVKGDIQSGEWANREYGVRLSKGLELLIFTHGNKDVGH